MEQEDYIAFDKESNDVNFPQPEPKKFIKQQILPQQPQLSQESNTSQDLHLSLKQRYELQMKLKQQQQEQMQQMQQQFEQHMQNYMIKPVLPTIPLSTNPVNKLHEKYLQKMQQYGKDDGKSSVSSQVSQCLSQKSTTPLQNITNFNLQQKNQLQSLDSLFLSQKTMINSLPNHINLSQQSGTSSVVDNNMLQNLLLTQESGMVVRNYQQQIPNLMNMFQTQTTNSYNNTNSIFNLQNSLFFPPTQSSMNTKITNSKQNLVNNENLEEGEVTSDNETVSFSQQTEKEMMKINNQVKKKTADKSSINSNKIKGKLSLASLKKLTAGKTSIVSLRQQSVSKILLQESMPEGFMLGDLELIDEELTDEENKNENNDFKSKSIERATPAYEKWAQKIQSQISQNNINRKRNFNTMNGSSIQNTLEIYKGSQHKFNYSHHSQFGQKQQQNNQQNANVPLGLPSLTQLGVQPIEKIGLKPQDKLQKVVPGSFKQQKMFMKPKVPVERIQNLTLQEGEKLLEVWKSNNFIDFNNWCQCAECEFKINFIEHQKKIDDLNYLSYSCTIQLKFPKGIDNKESGQPYVMKAQGLGKRKKQAKLSAYEKLTIDLIQQGLISHGLVNKKFLVQKPLNKKDGKLKSRKQKKKAQQEEMDKKLSKRIHKITRRIIEVLKENNFQEACLLLSQILQIKKPSWNEISHIWTHALQQRNLKYIFLILDIIENKKIRMPSEIEPLIQPHYQNYQPWKIRNDEKTKSYLESIYGHLRAYTGNPYDIFDFGCVENNQSEIVYENTPVINENEFNRELLVSPFIKELRDTLIPFSYDCDLNKYITSNQPFGYNGLKNLEKRKLNVPLNVLEEEQEEGEDEKLIFDEGLGPLNQIKCQKPDQGIMYASEEENIKQAKDPKKNLFSSTLLNHFYESILYIGDLNFSLQVAELLNAKCKIDFDGFLTTKSAYYYAHKKNLMTIELLEMIYNVFNKQKIQQSLEYMTNISGTVETIGHKYTQEVILMSPSEEVEQLELKLLKKSQIMMDFNQTYHQIAEGEFVLLTTFFQPTYDQPFLSKSHSALANFINNLAKNTQENRTFINCITEFGNIIEFAMIATVKEIKNFKLKMFVQPSYHESEALKNKSRKWKITKLVNRSLQEAVQYQLQDFCQNLMINETLLQLILSTPEANPAILQKQAETKIVYEPSNTVSNLNESQKEVLNRASQQLLTIVQGPPGSGKTVLAVEIIAEWIRQKPQQILMVTDTDQQANFMHTELQRAGIKSLRLKAGFDEYEDLRVVKNVKQQKFEKENKLKYFTAKKRLLTSQVIVVTCNEASSAYICKSKFTRIIIDEAHRIIEPFTFLALGKHCQQLVLIGDIRMQRSPLYSQYAMSKGYGISLYERLIRQGLKAHFLNIQYRLHSSISAFPSIYFYQNQLRNGINDDLRPQITGFPWPDTTYNMAFIHTPGPEIIFQDSLINISEVKIVVEVFFNILQAQNIRVNQISILTTFESQKNKIRQEINYQAKKYPQLLSLNNEEAQRIRSTSKLCEVEVIDEYKGNLKDLIILSTVRSNKNGLLGIIKDPNRLNTLITRAKRGMIIIGDIDTLQIDKSWKELLKYNKRNNLIYRYQ